MRVTGEELLRAARAMRRAPGLLVFATAALALGTAAPTTMYSIAHGVLRELPVPDGERIIHIAAVDPQNFADRLNLRAHDVLELRVQQRLLAGLAAFRVVQHDIAAPGERPERRAGAVITADAFHMLGVRPALGRDFSAADAVPGAPPAVIISESLWQSRYAGAPDVPGRTLRIDGSEATIIGVMPPGFGFPNAAQLWTPLSLDPGAAPQRGGWQYVAFGRLPPGVALDAARAELAGIARRLEGALPGINDGVSYVARPYREQLLDRDQRRIVRVMVVLVLCVLLVAAANVANLLVARAVARSRDIAVRAALGATRARIIGEHMLEATVIALAGGALGFALSRAGMAAFTRAMAGELPYWATFQLELPVLLFAALCIIAAALAAGTVPALQASGVDVNEALRDESRGASSFRLGRVSRGLVVAQIALSCTLLIVSGLMVKGVLIMSRTDNYEPDRILTARFELRPAGWDAARLAGTHAELLDRLNAVPGVSAAALTSHLPGVWTGWRRIEIEGEAYAADGERPQVHAAMVSPGFFTAAGAPPLRGRDFARADDETAARVVIVNQPFADRFFAGTDPIGRRVRSFRGTLEPEPWAEIIAVAPHVGVSTESGDPSDAVYFPLAQQPVRSTAVLLHTAGDPLALLPALRAAVDALGGELPLFGVGRLDRVIREARTIERVFGVLFAVFGAAALLLAAIGLYGTISFGVARRTRELGVRSALGAQPHDVVWLVVRGGVIQIGIGATAGIAGALLVAPLMGDALFGISPRDAAVYAAVPLMLAAAGLAAVVVPALRAARLDPTLALRE